MATAKPKAQGTANAATAAPTVELPPLPAVWVSPATMKGASGLWLRGARLDDGDVFHVHGAKTEQELPPVSHGERVAVVASDETHADLARGELPRTAVKKLAELGAAVVIATTLPTSVASPQSRAYFVRAPGDAKAEELLVRFIPGEAELFSRNQGVVPLDVLKNKTVAIVGAGSGGAPTAVELAKAGVGRFVLIDFERLELANIARHVLDTRDLGRLKTSALRDAVLARNPNAHVVSAALNCIDDHTRVLELLANENVDLIIAGTDSRVSRNHLNEMALSLDVPAIFGRTLARASRGDVFRMRAGGKPCLCCAYGEGEGLAAEKEEVTRKDDLPDYMEKGNVGKVQIIPGLSNDIAPFSQLITKLALIELCRGFDGVKELDEDFSASMFAWNNRRNFKEKADEESLLQTNEKPLPLGVSFSIVLPHNDMSKLFVTDPTLFEPVRRVLMDLSEAAVFKPITNSMDSDKNLFFVHVSTGLGKWTLAFGPDFALTRTAKLTPHLDKDPAHAFPVKFPQDKRPRDCVADALADERVQAVATRSDDFRIARWYGIEVPRGCPACGGVSLFEAFSGGQTEMSPENEALMRERAPFLFANKT